MPIYRYECPECGQRREDFLPVSQSAVMPICGCGHTMERDYSVRVGSGNKAFGTPIEMFSIAPENPEQERVLREACPDVEWNEPLKVPKAATREQKLRLLRTCGFEEHS